MDEQYQFIIEEMETIDRKVEKLESDVIMMNKQIGKRISEIRLLKEKYTKLSGLLKQNKEA